MPKVTVITPSIRKEGLKLVHESLKKQTFQDFDWYVGTPFYPNIPVDAIGPTWVKDDFTGGFWTLNRIYNKLFRVAPGEIIVTWQDYIWAPTDALQKFVDAVEATNGGIISGVGDQYETLNKYGKPEIKIWSDPRKNSRFGSFYECFPNDVEWNFSAFFRSTIFKVGGMDEELDLLGYGGDQLQVGERWNALGMKFWLDQENESYTLRHDRSDFGGQEKWDEHHVLFSGAYDKRKAELKKEGKWPVLDYLKLE